MGSKINVVLPNGKVVSVDEETYAALQGSKKVTRQSVEDEGAARNQREHDAKYSGVGSTLKAGALGAADALTFGAAGVAAGVVGGEDFRKDLQESAKAHPVAYGVGAIGASLLPVGAPGIAARAGRTVTGTIARGAESFGAGAAGRAVEGSLLGAGGHVASTNVTGDPLSIEGVLMDVGAGAILNVGMGIASDKFASVGRKANAKLDELAAAKQATAVVNEGRELFSKQLDSWDGFAGAVQSKTKADRQAFTESKKAADKYDSFVSGKGLATEINKTEKTINTVTARYSEAKYAAAPSADALETAAAATDMRATLADYRNRLRRVDQLRSGGWDVDGTQRAGRWVKDPSVAPDAARATEELRALRDEMAQRFPSATRKAGWNELPTPASRLPEPDDLKLPRDLSELAAMKPQTVERLSNAIANDAATSAEFAKLARELGVDATDGVAGLHSKLGRYVKAAEELAKVEATEQSSGLLGVIRAGARKAVSPASAALAVGDWLGGGLAARFVGSQAADLIAGALMQGKSNARQAVTRAIANIAPKVSSAARELSPIAAYLQSHLVTGDRDDSTDDAGELAKKRIGEIIGSSYTAADAVYLAVQPLLGDDSDAGYKLHQKIVGDLKYLADTAPKDPGIAQHGLESFWAPSFDQALEYAHRIEAVTNPLQAIERTIAGDGHPGGVEALWARWPALMQEAAAELAFSADKLADLTYEQAGHLSLLFRTPITGLMDPEVAMEIQGVYLPKPEQGAQQQRAPSPNPPGRPAAVQSAVAGSSVAKLLGQ